MNQPTPAIVAQVAVKRFPRWALWLFCAAYVLPGFLGRNPWKRADINSFGDMIDLAHAQANGWMSVLKTAQSGLDAPLPYWLGAWTLQAAPDWLPMDLAVRLPFIGLLIVTMIATWYGTYYLARSPMAQPVAFAFGGEAQPTDYARAIADGSLLAFVACLGLAQLAHETTPALAQLCFAALLFYAGAALPYRRFGPLVGTAVGLAGLTLCGAPCVALLSGLSVALIHLSGNVVQASDPIRRRALAVLGMALLSALLASVLELWRWRIDLPQAQWSEWQSLGRLFLWFTWPAWPLSLWTLWRWRHQWLQARLSARHIWLPLSFAVIASAATLTTDAAERSLLLSLPALAALAAFALPTLSRNVGALIDWFTLIFFSSCALIIWIVWLSMQTGVPAQPALNVARLAPGFEPSFSAVHFLFALVASLTWIWLVKWRVGRHQAALWKSVVLPAGGAALCWLLLMTLWLPLLDFARSYVPMVSQASRLMGHRPACVAIQGLSRSQIVAFQFHGQLHLQPLTVDSTCPWLVTDEAAAEGLKGTTLLRNWAFRATIGHPSDRDEHLFLYAHQGN